MEKVYFGNFRKESKRNAGWFIGCFLDEELRKRDDIEIKFWEFPPGKTDHEMKFEPKALEITILLKGRIEGSIEDREKEKYEKIKLDAGDYVIIPANVINGFPETILEYAEGITIKIPSKRDQKKITKETYQELKRIRDNNIKNGVNSDF